MKNSISYSKTSGHLPAFLDDSQLDQSRFTQQATSKFGGQNNSKHLGIFQTYLFFYFRHLRDIFQNALRPIYMLLLLLLNYYSLAQTTQQSFCTISEFEQSWEYDGPPSGVNWGGMPGLGLISAVAMDENNTNVLYAGSNTAGLYKSVDGGANWYSITDQLNVPGLGITSVALDPNNSNVIYAATGTTSNGYGGFSKGLIKSIDGGANWMFLNLPYMQFANRDKNIVLQIVKVHPTLPNIVVVGGYRNVWVSHNSGLSWEANFPNDYAIETNSAIAEDWSVCDIEFDPINPSIIFASTHDNRNDNTVSYPSYKHALILKSTDSGSTWEWLWQPNSPNSFLPNADEVILLDFPEAANGELYAAYLENTTPNTSGDSKFVIRKSSNGGESWTTVYEEGGNSTGFSFMKAEFEFSTQNLKSIYYGGTKFNKIFIESGSISNAEENTNFHDDIRDLKIYAGANGQDILLAGNDGGVSYVSANSELNIAGADNDLLWVNKNGDGLRITQIYGLGDWNNGNLSIYGAQDNGTWQTIGNIFNHVMGTDGAYSNVSEYFDNFGVAGSQSSKSYTSNGGYDWTTMTGSNDAPFLPESENLKLKHHFSPKDQRKLFVGANDLASWTFDPLAPLAQQLNSVGLVHDFLWPNGGSQKISALGIAPSDGQTMYVAFEGPYWNSVSALNNLNVPDVMNGSGELINRFFKSIDGGLTFEDITNKFKLTNDNNVNYPYEWDYVSCITVDPLNASHIFVGFREYKGDPEYLRVLESDDGGDTWHEMSMGLPKYGVHQLLYQDGTDEIIYAATDAGVYRWNMQLQTWECFNNGLPPCIVTSIDIDYCEGTMMASTYGKGIWKVALPSHNHDMVFTSDYTIEQFETHLYENNVIVESGATLTVKGHLFFKEHRRLTVKPGGKLILDGGLLTNKCGGLWIGVEVIGNDELAQLPSTNQGEIEIRNGGTIEHAAIGVAVKQLDDQCNFVAGTGGGIVDAIDAILRNNNVDVEYAPYIWTNNQGNSVSNKSRFENCTFITNNLLPDGFTSKWHVRLEDVYGINFKGCTFKNDRSVDNVQDQEGTGISSSNATFSVVSLCDLPDGQTPFPGESCPSNYVVHCKFENLNKAIVHNNVLSTATFAVRDAQFLGNNYGVFAQGTHSLSITGCNFQVNPAAFVMNEDTDIPYGVHLYVCSGYEIEQNTFTGEGQSLERVGLDISSSSGFLYDIGVLYIEEPNRIYNNNFYSLSYATIAQGDNRMDDDPNEGLELLCSLYENNLYDIAVTGGGGKIAGKQGNDALNQFDPNSEIYPHGNLFSNNATGCDDQNAIHMNPGTLNSFFFYKEYNDGDGPQYNTYVHPFDCATNGQAYQWQLQNEDLEPMIWTTRLQECDNGISLDENSSNGFGMIVNSNTNKLDQLQQQKQLVEDGGQTMLLLTEVTNGTSTSLQVRNQMLPYCPNLSDEVLIELMQRQPALEPYHLCDILLQCSPLSVAVRDFYDTNLPLSGFFHTMLMQYQNGEPTELNIVKSQIKEVRAVQELARHDYYRWHYFNADETQTAHGYAAIKEMATLHNRMLDKRTLISIAITQKNYVEAQSLIDNYPTDDMNDKWSEVVQIYLTL